jgi:hypothetical protein
MSKNISLDGLRAKVEEKYEPLEIDTPQGTFVLRPVLRCSKAEREQVLSKLEALGQAEEEDSKVSTVDRLENLMAVAREVISIVTADKRGAELIKLLGEDAPLALEILNQWQEATQPGEASSSQD